MNGGHNSPRAPHRNVLAVARLLMLLAALVATNTDADVVDVVPMPAASNIAVASPTTIRVSWRVERDDRTGAPATVTSPSGQFLLGGRVVGTVQRPLSRTVPAAAPGTGRQSIVIAESVAVPRAIAMQAARSGQVLQYARSFDDGSGTASTGDVRLAIVGGAGAAFTVARAELLFDDASRYRVTPAQATLRAVADIQFNGSGLLQAVWEIAEPTSTAGEPMFRPVGLIRRNLSGGTRIRIDSPELPTTAGGLYILRLRVISPEVAFASPELRYFVSEAVLPTIRLDAPAPQQQLTSDTRFAWQGVDRARAYAIEFVPAGTPDGVAVRPLAGLVVPAPETTARLEAVTLLHLQPGEAYRWRVRAIGDAGAAAGFSPWRDIRVAPQAGASRPPDEAAE